MINNLDKSVILAEFINSCEVVRVYALDVQDIKLRCKVKIPDIRICSL